MHINVLKSKLAIKFMSFIDTLFALIVVAPFVIIFWSTTWKLYDIFILPGQPALSGAISWLFGFSGQIALMFYQDSIMNLLNFGNRNFLNVIVLKIYALFLGHTFVSFWRGVWSSVDAASSKDLGVVVLNITQNIITLMILRAFRNTLVPPFIVLTDKHDQYFMITFLRKSKANGSLTYFVDCLCTMFVETLIAFIWHDFWFIHDSNILPDDLFHSALASLLIGYLLAFICFALQKPIGIICEKYDYERVLIYDAFTMICLLSAINVWRGVWSFVTYYTGDNVEWILMLNTLAWSMLMIVNCSFSISAKDVLRDAELTGRSCTKFQIQFFSDLLFKETDKKVNGNVTISTKL